MSVSLPTLLVLLLSVLLNYPVLASDADCTVFEVTTVLDNVSKQ